MEDGLPVEVLTQVFSMVDEPKDLISMGQVSKLWHQIASDQELWRRFCLRRYKVCRIELFENDWRKYHHHIAHTTLSPVNRILVHTLDGNYITISPDGKGIFPITLDPPDRIQFYGQGTWAPHGDYVIITHYRGTAHKSNLLLYNLKENKISIKYETPQHPFYFLWAPDSTRMAFLSNWPTHSIAIHSVDVAKQSPLTNIGHGRPYYYCFDPNGGPLILAHYGMGNMEFVNVDTGERKDAAHSGNLSSFTCPYWLHTNDIVYACKFTREDESEALKIVAGQLEPPLGREELEKLPPHELMRMLAERSIPFQPDDNNLVDKVLTHVMEKQERRTEYTLAELDYEEVDVDFVCSPDARYMAYTNNNVLHLVDIPAKKANKDFPDIVVHDNTVTFFWSPNSRYLLFNAVPRLSTIQHRFSLMIYDVLLKESYELTKYDASTEFRQHYLPFFCQYAQSMTFFSPCSQYCVYSSNNNVYICGVAKGSVPRGLTEGTFATWSPC